MTDNTQAFKVRIKFKKYGLMKFIGHLDMMRFFQKLFRRSELDIAYSSGFHPHQIMSFANPLGVGLLSEGEYMDVTMNSITSSVDMIDRLNKVSVEGVEIVEAVLLHEGAGKGMASIAMADYRIDFKNDFSGERDSLTACISSFIDRDEILIEKKTKKGSKIINLKEAIKELYHKDGQIFMKVCAGSALNIRPEMVIGAIADFGGITLSDFSYEITRLEQYDEKGNRLIDVGSVF